MTSSVPTAWNRCWCYVRTLDKKTWVRTLLLAAVFGTTGCGACEPDGPPPPAASAAPAASSASPMPGASAPFASHLPHGPTATKPACRVIAVDGEAHIETPGVDAGTTPLLLQGLAPTEAWIALARGSRVIARDPRTTRETTFRGPARVRACVGYSEESWLASGSFESAVGAGESPGAEEWVVTPSGIVRYTAAKLTVEVQPHGADVTLESGSAFAWQPAAPGDAGGALEEGWIRLAPGKTRLGGPSGEPVAATLDRCVALSARARALAARVMAPGGVDASTITEQVTIRRLARAACGVATLRVNALAPAAAAPLLTPLADANSAWTGLPGGAP